MLKEKDR